MGHLSTLFENTSRLLNIGENVLEQSASVIACQTIDITKTA